MRYNEFGSTGKKISLLGFGGMRFPEEQAGDKWRIREDEAIEMLHHAFENGVNYVDTAFMYCRGNSEELVGKALKERRDKVHLSTKLPLHDVKKSSDFERIFEIQLKRLDVDCIDFYHLHAVDKDKFYNVVQKFNLLEKMEKAKSDGLIKHASFSFHDKPEVLKMIIDTGFFESMLVQYNLLDRSNEEMISYAKKKGIGTVVMSPVGGGTLEMPAKMVDENIYHSLGNMPETALRFILSNPDVDCIISGMGSMQMVQENIRVINEFRKLTGEEKKNVDAYAKEISKLLDIFCTGCNYCMPCPHAINIPIAFRCLIQHKVYGMENAAAGLYSMIGKTPWFPGKTAGECEECGDCLPLCPQNIDITGQLRETAELFGK